MPPLGSRLPLAFWLWPSPACLFASGGGWAGPLPVRCWLAFLWYSLNPLFCEWAQQWLRLEHFVGKFFLFFFHLWLSHILGCYLNISSLRLSSGHSGLVLTLSNSAHTSLFSPHLLVGDVSVWATFLLGVSVRHVICELFIYLFIYFSSQLCCPLRFQNSPQTCWWEGFLVFGNFSSFKTPFLGRLSIPTSFVSLFIFYILSYLLLKTMGCLSGCLVSYASVRSCFVVFAQCSNDLLMNLWGRKWSPHPIPPPSSRYLFYDLGNCKPS